ncbi:MAG TPA: hypothetical protein VMU81_23080 [Acetobacteraceae bacterium]|nr:hypothetical protein [Acetobacteraceae bacterium]
MAIEPLLAAKADPNDCQNCLRALLAGAIDRADSGVLITAMRRGDSVAIEILDDGSIKSVAHDLPKFEIVPPGLAVAAEYLPQHGVKVTLRLPYAQIDPIGDAGT